MAELNPASFRQHLESIVEEYQSNKKIYGYSADFFLKPDNALDYSVDSCAKKAATPLGPAAGPHTQLAQNILLSWLHGSRIIELKTIQVLDKLEIPRPCIDMRNIGYNVEWSQELSLDDSFTEYASAWTLIHLIPYLDIFNVPPDAPFYNTIFDMSAGYDLQGISSDSVSNWLRHMGNATDQINGLLDSLPPKFDRLKSISIPGQISDTITLSTFHGCPAGEIEDIVEYLIAELDLNVVVKMNPTLGGLEFTREILNNRLGYSEIELVESAFEHDLNFDQAVAMMNRLTSFSEKHNRIVGAKFTNTLVVRNHENIFEEKERYLSGAPLYVLALQLASRFRRAMGPDFPLSFSGGINKNNFAEAVAANLAPVTTCSDLLTKGGYKKLFFYIDNLRKSMLDNHSRNLTDFIRNFSESEQDEFTAAGRENLESIANSALEDLDYRQQKNRRTPKKMDSQLSRFDCLSCNICIPVCPNAANFNFRSGLINRPIIRFGLQNGKIFSSEESRFELHKEIQIGTLVDFCNQCGNCDTFCPEQGGPYLQKSLFFLHKETYKKNPDMDGFFFDSSQTVLARIDGIEYKLEWDPKNDFFNWSGAGWNALFDNQSRFMNLESTTDIQLNSAEFEITRTVFEGIRAQAQRYPHAMLLASAKVSPEIE